jgi:hypothetical protein
MQGDGIDSWFFIVVVATVCLINISGALSLYSPVTRVSKRNSFPLKVKLPSCFALQGSHAYSRLSL